MHGMPRRDPHQAAYFGGVIQTRLMLRSAFKLLLRQAVGLMDSTIGLEESRS